MPPPVRRQRNFNLRTFETLLETRQYNLANEYLRERMDVLPPFEETPNKIREHLQSHTKFDTWESVSNALSMLVPLMIKEDSL